MLVQACAPWRGMALDDVTGEFRGVLQEVLRMTDDAGPDARAERLRRVARRHGAFRRHQGCPAPVLGEEIAFAAEAIEMALVRSGATPSVVVIIRDSLAPVLRAIARAMYGGYVDVIDRPRRIP